MSGLESSSEESSSESHHPSEKYSGGSFGMMKDKHSVGTPSFQDKDDVNMADF